MSPDEPGSSSPVAWAHGRVIHVFWEIEDSHEIVLFNGIDGLDVSDTCLSSTVDLLLNHFACAGKNVLIESCRTAEFDILCKGQVHILVLGFFLIFFLLVGTFGVFIPILLTLVIILTFVTITFVVASFVVGVIVSSMGILH